jgi:DNA polymerase
MTIDGGIEAAADGAAIRVAVAAWIEWQMAAGVDCTLGSSSRGVASPVLRAPAREAVPSPRPDPAPVRGAARVSRGAALAADARALARSCRTIEELRAALGSFDGCALAETATQLCFADGAPDAPLFLVGEAPGAEEDRIGRPFVGQSGQLLDRMLAWIGHDRTNTWITNAIFWRPPGNRTPTPAEIAVCQPFLERQIELLRPRILLFLGGIAARALLGVSEGVSRLRGRIFSYRNEALPEPIPALVTFHPAYLLRQPAQKRLVWRDLLQVADMLGKAGATPRPVPPITREGAKS